MILTLNALLLFIGAIFVAALVHEGVRYMKRTYGELYTMASLAIIAVALCAFLLSR